MSVTALMIERSATGICCAKQAGKSLIIRALHGHVDFLGGGAMSLKDEVCLTIRSPVCNWPEQQDHTFQMSISHAQPIGPIHASEHTVLTEQQKYEPTVLANSQVSFVVLSDVWLDHPRTIPALRRLFEGYSEAVEYKPMVFVLCGNFCQRGWEAEGGMKRYTSM